MNYYVYELVFPNNKKYIGITKQNPIDRWGGGGGYYGQMVYKPIKKYGWENIKHNILFSNLTKEDACQKERELIKEYNTTNILYGYNIGEGGECGCCISGEKHWTYNKSRPEATRKKISESLKGRYISKKNPHHTEVNQYTLDGVFIRQWDSLADIKRELGFNHPHIVGCCKGRINHAYGFKWSYNR